jgi:hypothetical protein
VNVRVERLVSSLLYEGYALYPYTPEATKNATPTPFGIVYPPAYAAANDATFDHLRVEAVLAAPGDAVVTATVRFLQASGERHQATERRLELTGALEEFAGDGVGTRFAFEGVQGRARCRAEALAGTGRWRLRACVHNTTDVAAGLERRDALVASLISTHAVLETPGGRFASPLERDGEIGAEVERCVSVNTFPVLASPGDDALLGATIVLPDHPEISPQSLGNLFDNTEIEEALMLHVQALSDPERAAIAEQDPAVREMLDRADAAREADLAPLHGLMTPSDVLGEPEPGHPNPGEPELEIGGTRFRKGGKVVLRPGTDRDVYDRMLDGRRATIERLYLDYEDGAHVAVTIDDDPAQELFRETGRYLFFKGSELEVIAE